jgi:hypothetical protein
VRDPAFGPDRRRILPSEALGSAARVAYADAFEGVWHEVGEVVALRSRAIP